MKFLLDSNAVIAILKKHTVFLARLQQHQPRDFGISSVVAHELFYGVYKSQKSAENLARLDRLQFEVLPLDREDALHAGQLRAELTKMGNPIGPLDTLIAGQALSRALTLITHNTREFRRVKKLRVEDWES